jgi:hypothetical protein
VPRTRSRYFEYALLLHLLPKRVLDTFGLPKLRTGQWPFLADYAGIDDFMPPDFDARLARAWASTVWPHLISWSKMKAFSADDPIRLLAHNLDFWVPAVTATIQDRLRDFPEVDKGKTPGPVTLVDGSVLAGAVAGNPRMGGPVWFGEDDAHDALVETAEAAARLAAYAASLTRSARTGSRTTSQATGRTRRLRTQAALQTAQGHSEVRRTGRTDSRTNWATTPGSPATPWTGFADGSATHRSSRLNLPRCLG